SFFYIRSQKLGPDSPPTAKYQKLKAYRHTLGNDPDQEPAVFGYEVNRNVKVTENDFPILLYSAGAPKYVVGLVIHGVKREFDVYSLPLDSNPGGNTQWKKAADESDEVTGLDLHGEDLYLVSHKDASRFKVLRTSLASPDAAHAQLVVPASEVVVTNISAAADA
ncbi:MAG: hypothetical protein DMG90_17380, partial [Acidobacteria bacterium]